MRTIWMIDIKWLGYLMEEIYSKHLNNAFIKCYKIRVTVSKCMNIHAWKHGLLVFDSRSFAYVICCIIKIYVKLNLYLERWIIVHEGNHMEVYSEINVCTIFAYKALDWYVECCKYQFLVLCFLVYLVRNCYSYSNKIEKQKI